MLCPICKSELLTKKAEYIKPNSPTMYCPKKCKNHKGFNISEWDASQPEMQETANQVQQNSTQPPQSNKEEAMARMSVIRGSCEVIAAEIHAGVKFGNKAQAITTLATELLNFIKK